MKNIILILMIGVLAFIACENDEGPDLAAPQNLGLTVWQNGAGLKIQWNEVTDANAYYLYFGLYNDEDSLNAICKVVSPNYYIHDSISLTSGGYYGVLAVGGDYDETVGPMSDIVRSAAVKSANVILYDRDYDGGSSAAFGWDMDNGEAFITSINDASTRWHFYLDDGTPGEIVDSMFRFVVPGDSVGANSPPDVPWSGTSIVKSSASYAPARITGGYAPTAGGIFEDFVFYLKIDDTYYAKLYVKEILENGVKFDAYFQEMEGFRHF
ncbi:hypothetical protein JXI42_13625 [bacterium]|nr:hypothetical protein [bacterium]